MLLSKRSSILLMALNVMVSLAVVEQVTAAPLNEINYRIGSRSVRCRLLNSVAVSTRIRNGSGRFQSSQTITRNYLRSLQSLHRMRTSRSVRARIRNTSLELFKVAQAEATCGSAFAIALPSPGRLPSPTLDPRCRLDLQPNQAIDPNDAIEALNRYATRHFDFDQNGISNIQDLYQYYNQYSIYAGQQINCTPVEAPPPTSTPVSTEPPSSEYLPIDANGFTIFSPSTDSRIIYVSNSGSDSNDGLSEQTPKRTIAAGYALLRDGFPDWLLLRAGEEFRESVPFWEKSGRSNFEPIRLGGYGVGARPLLKTGTSGGFTGCRCGRGSAPHHLAITDLEFWADENRYGAAQAVGISILDWDHVLIENVAVRNYASNITIQGYDNPTIHDIRVRKSVIADSANVLNARSAGLLCGHIDRLVVEGNYFVHNGWSETIRAQVDSSWNLPFQNSASTWQLDPPNSGMLDDLRDNGHSMFRVYSAQEVEITPNSYCYGYSHPDPSNPQSPFCYGLVVHLSDNSNPNTNGRVLDYLAAAPSVFSHNLYINPDNVTHSVVRDNLAAQGAASGLRSCGEICEGNLVLENPVGIALGPDTQKVIRNVIIDSRDINSAEPRGIGIDGSTAKNDIEIADNIVAHQRRGTGNTKALSIGIAPNTSGMRIHDNIVYDWTQNVNVFAPGLSLNNANLASDTYVFNNDFQMANFGQMWAGGSIYERIVEQFEPTKMRFSGNRYFGGANANPFLVMFLSYDAWLALSHESGSSFGAVSYPNAAADISSYLRSIGGEPGELSWYLMQVRRQQKGSFRSQYAPSAAISYFRAAFGRP